MFISALALNSPLLIVTPSALYIFAVNVNVVLSTFFSESALITSYPYPDEPLPKIRWFPVPSPPLIKFNSKSINICRQNIIFPGHTLSSHLYICLALMIWTINRETNYFDMFLCVKFTHPDITKININRITVIYLAWRNYNRSRDVDWNINCP